MSIDVDVIIARKAKERTPIEGDVAVASLWLVLYLIMLVGAIGRQVFARVLEIAALY